MFSIYAGIIWYGQFFRYKVFADALFHLEVMSIFNLPIDNRYFTLHLFNIVLMMFHVTTIRVELATWKMLWIDN